MKEVKEVNIKNKDDKGFKATIKYDDGSVDQNEDLLTFEQATDWVDSVAYQATDTPELPASETSIEQAEEINSNVHTAGHPKGAEQVVSGGGNSAVSNSEAPSSDDNSKDDKATDSDNKDDSKASESVSRDYVQDNPENEKKD